MVIIYNHRIYTSFHTMYNKHILKCCNANKISHKALTNHALRNKYLYIYKSTQARQSDKMLISKTNRIILATKQFSSSHLKRP